MFLTRAEREFLVLLGSYVRGERKFTDTELWSSGVVLGLKSRRELLFLSESFREDGDINLKFSPREIGQMMRKRCISRLIDWGWHEGLCDSCRLSDEEFQSWLTGMIRDTSLDFKERKWAAETWLRLRGQDVKRSSSESGGGAKVQIVISNPYGGSGGVGNMVEVRSVDGVGGSGQVVSGVESRSLSEDTECKS